MSFRVDSSDNMLVDFSTFMGDFSRYLLADEKHRQQISVAQEANCSITEYVLNILNQQMDDALFKETLSLVGQKINAGHLQSNNIIQGLYESIHPNKQTGRKVHVTANEALTVFKLKLQGYVLSHERLFQEMKRLHAVLSVTEDYQELKDLFYRVVSSEVTPVFCYRLGIKSRRIKTIKSGEDESGDEAPSATATESTGIHVPTPTPIPILRPKTFRRTYSAADAFPPEVFLDPSVHSQSIPKTEAGTEAGADFSRTILAFMRPQIGLKQFQVNGFRSLSRASSAASTPNPAQTSSFAGGLVIEKEIVATRSSGTPKAAVQGGFLGSGLSQLFKPVAT